MAKKDKSTRVRETAGDRALQAFTTAFMIFVLGPEVESLPP